MLLEGGPNRPPDGRDDEKHPGGLTSPVLPDGLVGGGEVRVHVVLEHLLKEAPLLQPELLACRVHVGAPLAWLALRCRHRNRGGKKIERYCWLCCCLPWLSLGGDI